MQIGDTVQHSNDFWIAVWILLFRAYLWGSGWGFPSLVRYNLSQTVWYQLVSRRWTPTNQRTYRHCQLPISWHKLTCRYITLFRSKLSKDLLKQVFPNVVALLLAESNVVHSYAAITIERLLALKISGQPLFVPADVASCLEQLLSNLFAAFEKPDSATNEYVMMCVMRVISFVGPQIIPVADICMDRWVDCLNLHHSVRWTQQAVKFFSKFIYYCFWILWPYKYVFFHNRNK